MSVEQQTGRHPAASGEAAKEPAAHLQRTVVVQQFHARLEADCMPFHRRGHVDVQQVAQTDKPHLRLWVQCRPTLSAAVLTLTPCMPDYAVRPLSRSMAALLLSAAAVLDESSVGPARHDDFRFCDVCGVWAPGDWQRHVEGGCHRAGLRLVEVQFALATCLVGTHLPAGHVRHMAICFIDHG